VPGRADAGLNDYPSPLYLSGTAALSSLPTSYALVASPGPGQPTGQISGNITCLLCSSGNLGASTYSYAYTVVDPSGGETAIDAPAPAFTTVTGATGKSVEVTGLPTGVHVKLYRSTTNPALYNLVKDLPNNGSSTYDVDDLSDGSASAAPILPQAQNRATTGAGGLGFQDFSAGTPVTNTLATSYDATPTTPPANGKGWIVDGSGGVSFPGGNWSFTAIVRLNGTALQLGIAHLAVGVWKVTTSGGAIASSTLLIDPTCSAAPCGSSAAPGENTTNILSPTSTLVTKTGTTHANTTLDGLPNTTSISVGSTVVGADVPAGTTVTAIPTSSSVTLSKAATDSHTGNYQFNGVKIITQVSNVSWFTLASNEHLYVQFYRRQTGAASTLTGLATMYTYDGVAAITHPTVPNTPAIVSPAAGVRVNTMPQLTATMSDPDVTDTGTLSFQVCSDSACNAVVQSGSASGIANGANGSWAPTGLPDGTYHWNVQATDSVGNQSAWSTPTRSFTVDTTPPGLPTLDTPVAGGRANTTQLATTFVDSDLTDTGTVTFEFCSDPACSTVLSSSTSATQVSGGTSVSWTATGAGGDGTYYWHARAQDLLGNQTPSWTPVQSFVLDTNPPDTPTLGAPTDGSYLGAAPTLHATFKSSDVGDRGTITFELCSDATCGSVLVAHDSASNLADGAAGSWAPTGLTDGPHYWQALATDAAGNVSGSSTVQSFTLDMTDPSVPTFDAVAARAQTTPQLSATFADPPASDSGTLRFELCADSACTSLLQSHTASGVANNTKANWTPSSLADGIYYWRVQATDSAAHSSAWSAASSFAVDTTPPGLPAFVSPANADRVNVTQLAATFVDSDPNDTGTVTFQLCSDAACSTVLTSSTSATVGGGTGVSWAPGGLADGTYYWRLSGLDVAGNQGAWTATHRFVLDTNPPAVPTLAGPAAGAHVGARPDLGGTFTTGDSGDSGSLSFQVCTDGACTSVVQTGSSSSGLSSGATGTWTPASLADGVYYWRARATDAVGNQSTWSATESFTVDTVPPSAPSASGLADGKLLDQAPTLTSSYPDPTTGGDSGSLLFQVCTTSACTTLVGSTTVAGLNQNDVGSWTPPGLGNGTYYWRVRAEDAAGNLSAWSAVRSFSIDNTPPPAPVVTIASGAHVSAAPQLGATVIEPGNPGDSARLLVELCTDPACTSIVTTGYSGVVSVDTPAGWQAPALPDGVYYWRALAEDTAGNQSPWSAVGSFVVDTVAPAVPALGSPAAGAIVNTARLTGVPGTPAHGIEFQVCVDVACTKVVAGGYTLSPASGAAPSWTPEGLPDGTYFWRIAAHDEAGNASAWSETKSFVLDQTPPGTPRALQAKVTGTTLTLRWKAPALAHHLAGYTLLVNGRRTQILTLKTHTVRIKLRKSETRLFAIASVDAAGNVSRPTRQVAADSLRLANRTARGAAAPVPVPHRR
jgi:hypothetical protein